MPVVFVCSIQLFISRKNYRDPSIVSPTLELVNPSTLGSSAVSRVPSSIPMVGVDVSLFMLRISQSSLRRQPQRHKFPRFSYSLSFSSPSLAVVPLVLRVSGLRYTTSRTLTLSSPPSGWFPHGRSPAMLALNRDTAKVREK